MDQNQGKSDTRQLKVKTEVDVKTETDEISAARALHAQIDLSSIKSAISEKSTPGLEEAARKGLTLLHELFPNIKDLASLGTNSTARKDDASKWAAKISEILSLSRPTRTLIGVVGPTGAGKSSLINGLLDEEKLLPTSCSRACTACVTEVSFNHDEDENMPYKAEVEFISSSEWAQEIETLLRDITDDESSKNREAEEDAKSAFERIAAVYPGISPQTIPKMSLDDFLTEVEVQKVLGRTIVLKDASSEELYKQIQGYFESKPRDNNPELDHWPLIKMVRVFTKSTVLSTGVVLVDLPGLQDSNAARAAVATQYQKACSALWIVTPITRAVDDKSANDLMRDSFRRQMMFDGLYSAVTVICSKTDDIHVEEAIANLGLSKDLMHDLEKVRSLGVEIQNLEIEIRDLKRQKVKLRAEFRKTDDELSACDTTLERIQSDQAAKESVSQDGKRKFTASGGLSEFATTEQAESHVNSLRDETRRLHENINLVCRDIEEKEEIQLISLQNQKSELWTSAKESCIRKRNSASVASIKRRFAECIREIDTSNALEKNEDTFDPDEQGKDYNRIGDNLPVFCVSSRVYQRMIGQMMIEDITTIGFRHRCDTGITDLQAHARNLTESSRVAKYRQILSKLGFLLNSISYWVTGRDIELAGQDTKSVTKFLEDHAGELEKNLKQAAENCCNKFDFALKSEIFDNLDNLVKVAAREAIAIAEEWFLPSRYGGLNPGTFKSVCKNHGTRSQAKYGGRAIDLHQQLANPVTDGILKSWDKTFSREVPIALDQFTRESTQHLRDFICVLERKYKTSGPLHAALELLRGHVDEISDRVSVTSVEIKSYIDQAQKEANRAFVPPIQTAMKPVWAECLTITGKGSTKAKRELVTGIMKSTGKKMFRSSASATTERLRLMQSDFTDDLKAGNKQTYQGLKDAASFIFMPATQNRELSDDEIRLRGTVMAILRTIPDRFKQA